MSLLNYRKSQSRAFVRGHMLVAWFADATPPVLWRWPAGETTSSFGIRQKNGKLELVKYDIAGDAVVIATFASIERAERALAKLSGALVNQQSIFSKFVKAILILLGLLFILFLTREIYTSTSGQKPAGTHAASVGTGAPLPADLAPAQPPPGYPGVAPHPATLPSGSPVDVDSFYH